METVANLLIMGCAMKCGRQGGIIETYSIDPADRSQFVFTKESRGSFDGSYIMGKLLGTGGYSEVRECIHMATGARRAVKILKKNMYNLEFGSQEEFAREVEIMVSLDHPNINRVLEYFNEAYTVYMIIELCEGGELLAMLHENSRFNENRTAGIMKQLFSAVLYMHSLGIAHRDLKPANVLFQSKRGDDVKIVDFGLSTYLTSGKLMTGTVGTPIFVAPEVLEGQYDEKCDEWSLGVIMYMMLSGVPPFEGNTMSRVLERTRTMRFNSDRGVWKRISPEGVDLVRKLLSPADSRITAEMALNHPWVTRFCNAMEPQSPMLEDVFQNMKAYQRGAKLKEAALTFLSTQRLAQKDEQRLKSVFRCLDTNSDGRISVEELIAGFNKRKPGSISELEARELMDKIDSNGSGFIDYTEFLKSAIEKRILISKANLMSTFQLLDSDGSGTISTDELRRTLDLCDLDAKVIDQIIREVDEDGDGVIDIAEFVKMMEAE